MDKEKSESEESCSSEDDSVLSKRSIPDNIESDNSEQIYLDTD